jgi:uncharacterized protein involved in exopolysaccharide biosynthesis
LYASGSNVSEGILDKQMPSGLEQPETIDRVAGASTLFDEQENSIDLLALVRRARSGAKTIGTFVLVSIAAGVVLCFVLPVKYTSATSFIPPSNLSSGTGAAALAGQLSGLGGAEILGVGRTSGELYTGILRSRSVLGELVKKYDLMKVYKAKKELDAEKLLISDTVIGADPKSSIIAVSVTARTPQLAHDLASGYMDALRNTQDRLALTQSSQRRLFFGQQLVKEKDDLENAEVELKKTEEQTGLIAPTGQTEAQIRTIAETQAQVAVRQVELAALRQSATEQNPDLIRLRSEIADLQAQLGRLQQGQTSGITIPTSKVPAVQLDFVRKQREVKYHEALFEMLSRQYESARLDEAREAPALQVLDVASYPETKSSPRRTLVLIGAFLLGTVLGTTWIFVKDSVETFRQRLEQS